MGIRTLGLYLIGNRQAILDLAADRRALWIGALFVLSAGLARDYDGEDLLHEPWHLLIPFGASIAASFLLFMVVGGLMSLGRVNGPPFWSGYRAFLTLFWMTAPLAWLYAIPYERFLSPADAVRANLWTLALVALWRVVLMVRVVSVLTGIRSIAAVFLVMVFADVAAMIAVSQMPQPVIAVMGGVQLTESEAVINGVTILTWVFGILSAPVWGIGAVIAFFASKPTWISSGLSPEAGTRFLRPLWVLAIASLVIWAVVLPWTQREQQLRTQVEQDLKAGRITEAVALMSSHTPESFPPNWDPPPRVRSGEKSPPLCDVIDVVVDHPPAPWVREVYLQKFRDFLGHGPDNYLIDERTSDEIAGIVRVLRRLPQGSALAAELLESTEQTLRNNADLKPEDRQALEAIRDLGKTAADRKP